MIDKLLNTSSSTLIVALEFSFLTGLFHLEIKWRVERISNNTKRYYYLRTWFTRYVCTYLVFRNCVRVSFWAFAGHHLFSPAWWHLKVKEWKEIKIKNLFIKLVFIKRFLISKLFKSVIIRICYPFHTIQRSEADFYFKSFRLNSDNTRMWCPGLMHAFALVLDNDTQTIGWHSLAPSSSSYRVRQIPFFIGKCFKKKTTEYFLNFRFLFESTIHTYIHNWPLQPFTQDYWPSFSHHLCCVY